MWQMPLADQQPHFRPPRSFPDSTMEAGHVKYTYSQFPLLGDMVLAHDISVQEDCFFLTWNARAIVQCFPCTLPTLNADMVSGACDHRERPEETGAVNTDPALLGS